tara:strand:+ start:65 stop:382 length:318 start_codon:yes stop_codon:yes gene_type:complete
MLGVPTEEPPPLTLAEPLVEEVEPEALVRLDEERAAVLLLVVVAFADVVEVGGDEVTGETSTICVDLAGSLFAEVKGLEVVEDFEVALAEALEEEDLAIDKKIKG